MNFAVLNYRMHEPLDRFALLPPKQRFTLSDALVVMFWHDVEKIWRSQLDENYQLIFEPNGRVAAVPELEAKRDRIIFAAETIDSYGVELTPAMRNALEFVEGIRDSVYSPDDPLMWPLAALCHVCDLNSARFYPKHPLAENEPWGSRGQV